MSNDTPSPSDNAQNELQRQYGTNWTEKNFQTILNWTFIAAFYIEALEEAIECYRKIITNNIVLGLVLSTASGTLSSTRLGMDNDSPINFSLNILFTVMTFTIAIFTGTIKIYQIQERLENFIKIKQEWIVFSTTLASELQLPVNLRHDAYYIIIKNKNKYLDLLKIDSEIPNSIRENVRNKLIKKNSETSLKDHIDSFNITTLSDIIIQISSNENERFYAENQIDKSYNDLKLNFKNIINKELENKFLKDIKDKELDDRKENLLIISDNISDQILNNMFKNNEIKTVIENEFTNNNLESGNKFKDIFNVILQDNLKNIIENINDDKIKELSNDIINKKNQDEIKVLNTSDIPNVDDFKNIEEISPINNV